MESVTETCKIDWCEKPRRAAGWCGMHHARNLRGKDMNARPQKTYGAQRPYCIAPRCSSYADSALPGAVCAKHRIMMARKGSYTLSRVEALSILVCTIAGCDGRYASRGLCNAHVTRSNTYHLSAMQLDMLYRRAACDSCGAPCGPSELHIDHDHACCDIPKGGSCGKCIRGVLCMGCNVGLGAFGDSPARLEAAVRYLASR